MARRWAPLPVPRVAGCMIGTRRHRINKGDSMVKLNIIPVIPALAKNPLF
jgi:hypothetical protein